MGLFKKKKKTTDDGAASSSNVSLKRGVGRRTSDASPDLGGKVSQTTHGILTPSDFEPLDGVRQIDEVSTDSSRPSTGLKLRLRRSLSTLFLDRSKSSSGISTETSEERPRSPSPPPTSEECLQRPAPKPLECEEVKGTIEHEELRPAKLFTPPPDAPPVPPSPSPEQLAFLESNKLRLSASYHFVQEHDPPSGKSGMSTLLERRNLEHRKTQLSLSNPDLIDSISSAPLGSRLTQPTLVSSRDTSELVAVEFRGEQTSSPSLPSGSIWSGDDLSADTTSVWSNPIVRNSLVTDDSSNDSGSDSKEKSVSESPTPEIYFKIHTERIVANARFCDVLRTLFGSNGRVGITSQCKEHLLKAKQPRLLEISLGLRTPTLASYADDYPHGKFYVTCLDKTTRVDTQILDFPLEGISSGKTSFSKLDYPDNFFDVVVSGSIQFMLPKPDWPVVLSECYRVLKPGGWIDMLTSSASFQSSGPITKAYESQLLSCLDERNFYPNPGKILPSVLRTVGFTEITRTQLTLPTFWRDTEENNVCIRNARTGEETYMTMSEIGDRVSTLMYGFWEEIFGEWDYDVEDFAERNRIRRKEAEETKTWSLITKIGARKRGKLKEGRDRKRSQKAVI